jgi:cyclopropane fatty-acyl-phospholipid synthase-like methyltransferase
MNTSVEMIMSTISSALAAAQDTVGHSWAKKGATPMNPNKALWEKGDFTRIAESMRKSGEALGKGLEITKGLKVLDLGCGDGTTVLPEARFGANVLGVDIAKNLVEAGNKRAKEEGLTNCSSGR